VSSLTIAVLSYNNGEHIEQLLQSILQQEDANFNLLFVDNASTDNTWEVISSYQTHFERFRLIQMEENFGEAGGLRKILEQCNSDYVAIVHGDDVLGKGYSKAAHKNILKYPKAIVISFPIMHFSSDLSEPQLIGTSSWSKSRFLNRLLVCGLNPAIMPGVVINLRRTNLIDIFSRPFPGRYNADVLFWTRFARSGLKIRKARDFEYFYRRYPTQSSNSKDNNEILAESRIGIINEANSLLEKNLSRATIKKEEKLFPGYSGFRDLKDFKLSQPRQLFFGSLNFLVRLITKLY